MNACGLVRRGEFRAVMTADDTTAVDRMLAVAGR
jgi:hypothetical protein